MVVKDNLSDILKQLVEHASLIDEKEVDSFINCILSANHIFLTGAGRSGIAIKGFANRLLHLGFSVSVVGEITSPHSKPGDLIIFCSGSGETDSLVSLAVKASQSKVKIALVTMNTTSTIGKLSDSILYIPGKIKNEERNELEFIQPMGSLFEQLSFLTFDAIILNLMNKLKETSDTMLKRHADFE